MGAGPRAVTSRSERRLEGDADGEAPHRHSEGDGEQSRCPLDDRHKSDQRGSAYGTETTSAHWFPRPMEHVYMSMS